MAGLALLVALIGAHQAPARGRMHGLMPAASGLRAAATAAGSGQLGYRGGPVMHAHQTFVIFWDPNHALTDGFKARVNGFLTDVGQDSGTPTNPYSVAGEYYDAAGSVGYQSSFGGSYTDQAPYPLQPCATTPPGAAGPSCLTDAAFAGEVAADLSRNGWRAGLDRAYFVLTPPGVTSCQDATSGQCSTVYCAYHSQLDPRLYPSFPDADPVLYGVVPWAATASCQVPQSPSGIGADSAVNLTSHEHIEMLTDPLVDQPAWIDPVNGSEIADKCRQSYGTVIAGGYNQVINGHGYLLQGEFSNARGSCLERTRDNQPPVASFTVSSPDRQLFTFDAGASADPDGRVVSYRWDFGGGQTASGALTSHAYAGQSEQTVTLTVADNAGGQTSLTQTVEVGQPAAVRPTAPAPPLALPPPLTAGARFGPLSSGGLRGSVTVSRRVNASVDLLIPRATALRLRITALADGGPKSPLVVLGHALLGAIGPGPTNFGVHLYRRSLPSVRRAGPLVVTARLTLGAPHQPARVLSARRRLRLRLAARRP